MALTLLKVVHGQRCEFMSPKTASQKNCKYGSISIALEPILIPSLPKSLALVGR